MAFSIKFVCFVLTVSSAQIFLASSSRWSCNFCLIRSCCWGSFHISCKVAAALPWLYRRVWTRRRLSRPQRHRRKTRVWGRLDKNARRCPAHEARLSRRYRQLWPSPWSFPPQSVVPANRHILYCCHIVSPLSFLPGPSWCPSSVHIAPDKADSTVDKPHGLPIRPAILPPATSAALNGDSGLKKWSIISRWPWSNFVQQCLVSRQVHSPTYIADLLWSIQKVLYPKSPVQQSRTWHLFQCRL